MRPFAAVPRVVRASLVLVAVAVPALAAAQALPDAKALMDKHKDRKSTRLNSSHT